MLPARGMLVSMFIRLMAVARYRLIIELSVIFLSVWGGCALLVYYLEVGINPRIHNPLEAVYFLLVTMMTSGDSAVAPQTVGGRMVMSFVLVMSKLLTALLCALAAAIVIERKVREEMGLKMHKLQGHVVLVGWNMKGAQIIATLRKDPQHQSTPILVMCDTEQKPIDDPLVLFTRSPYPIRGEAIQRGCIPDAHTVVVLANYTERQNADALTAINCMLVRKLNPAARVIAELLDPSQRLYLEAAGADAIVGIGEVGGFLLAEAVIGSQQAKQLLDFVAPRPTLDVQPHA